ncbi:MAG: ABC transporter ATP-binding protein [Chloroflexi bacterium]|nr:ABC transporter ATP-binding protein [Chloroflexota bacterium]
MLALAPVDLSLRPGEFVSIVGPSGCGKSTLLLIVAGLLSATQGEIRIDGERLTKPLTDVGIVFQDDLLLDFRTTLDNVLLQSDIRRAPDRPEAEATARGLLRQLGLEGAERKYPHQLSGGMRQRASLARALVHDPSILLMDEPFGALDALTRTQMRRDLEQLWLERQKTVLFITHGVEEAVGLSDRVIVMSPSPGRIVEDITVELPRPRPVELGDDRAYTEYTDRIYRIFHDHGVLR